LPSLLPFPTRRSSDLVTLSVETPRTRVIAGIGLRAPAAETRARTETVPAPPRSAPELRFDSLVAHCTRREWQPQPGKNVFSNAADRKSTRLNSSHEWI